MTAWGVSKYYFLAHLFCFEKHRKKMRVPLNTTKWFDNALAAFIFFTRLPLWRVRQPPRECYRAVVEYWPLTGWLTGCVMAAVLYFGSLALPNYVAVLLAIAVRILLTGALHEDGLCDFFDGIGGGTSRQRILEIMKDSRIGTYGVLGVLLYVLLLFETLLSIPFPLAALAIIVADPYAKMLAAQVTQMLPYARTEEEAKSKTVYRRMSAAAGVRLFVMGFLPITAFLWVFREYVSWSVIVFGPCLVMYALYLIINKKLRGYTGDCCGAMFLLIELGVYICIASQTYKNLRLYDFLVSITGI